MNKNMVGNLLKMRENITISLKEKYIIYKYSLLDQAQLKKWNNICLA